MSERKPLTLEELRKMDGKPVWVECLITKNILAHLLGGVFCQNLYRVDLVFGIGKTVLLKGVTGQTGQRTTTNSPALTVQRGSRAIFARKNLTNTRTSSHIATTTKATRATSQRFAPRVAVR